MEKKYLNPGQPGSFSGLETFFRALKDQGQKTKKSEIKKFLQTLDAYTLHKKVRKTYPRNKVVAYGIDDCWQMDLVDMSKLANENENVKYMITCIDVFSKYAWVVPIKNKTAATVAQGFLKILETGRKPNNLQTDKGTEFLNETFTKLVKKNDINHYTLNSEQKASVVERFNRTLKEKMYRFFTYTKKNEYLSIIQNIVDAYNSTYHRSIKKRPVDINKKNENETFKILYDQEEDFPGFKLKVGDKVRVSKAKSVFAKGYERNWSREIFIIVERFLRVPPVYSIKDLAGEKIEGVFYEPELQKILKEDDVYQIDQIIKKRTRKGKTEYFVSWEGYPDKFNSWIKEEDLV